MSKPKVLFTATVMTDGHIHLEGPLENKNMCIRIVADILRSIANYKPSKIIEAKVIPKIKEH